MQKGACSVPTWVPKKGYFLCSIVLMYSVPFLQAEIASHGSAAETQRSSRPVGVQAMLSPDPVRLHGSSAPASHSAAAVCCSVARSANQCSKGSHIPSALQTCKSPCLA